MSPNNVLVFLVYVFVIVDNPVTCQETTYIVALLGQRIQNETFDSNIEYEFVMTNDENTGDVNVNISDINGDMNVNIPANDKRSTTFNETRALNGSEYSNKTIIFHASAPFRLQVFVKTENYVEGFLGVSIEKMNRSIDVFKAYEYVATTFCDTGGYCQLAVAALEDETAISIVLPDHVEDIIFCQGISLVNTGLTRFITLNKYDSFQLETTSDLTGTHIYSFKPISVFAGSRGVEHAGVVAHTIEQMVPTWHWGKEFVTKTLDTGEYGDILKITGSHSGVTVTMSGFHPFKLNGYHRTISRRLSKGSSTLIRATSPIQVMQISGLSYGVNDTVANNTLSMTFVPSVQSMITPNPIECNTGYTSSTIILRETSYANKFDDTVKYTKYDVLEGDPTVAEHKAMILKCGTTTMPASIWLNTSIDETEDLKPLEFSNDVCYGGGRIDVSFDSSSNLVTSPSITLMQDLILKLRARFCGEAVLQFYISNNDTQHSLLVRLRHGELRVTVCQSNSCNSTTVADSGNFNNADLIDCNKDMAFFWFYQDGAYLYVGFGHSVDITTATKFDIGSYFQKATINGLFTDARFNWDFEDPDGCQLYEESWRCFDRWANCSKYGAAFCSDSAFEAFANSYCSKYCGKCAADTYGRKFIGRLPQSTESSAIIVSAVNLNTGISVFIDDKVLPVKDLDSYTQFYDTTSAPNANFVIISDDDVTVTVWYHLATGHMSTYPVYPVDTYGYEYMLLGHDKDKTKDRFLCRFVSEFSDASVLPYYYLYLGNTIFPYGQKLTIDGAVVFLTNELNIYSGTVFTFDRPVGVFCGSLYRNDVNFTDTSQMLPTSTWSTNFLIPALSPPTASVILEAELAIITNNDNTVVNVSIGFDGTYLLFNRGDPQYIPIDTTSQYKVTASENIAVGIFIHNADKTRSTFHFIPPSSDLHNINIQSIPTGVLDTSFGFSPTDIRTYFIHGDGITEDVQRHRSGEKFLKYVETGGPKFGFTVAARDMASWFVMSSPMKITSKPVIPEICEVSDDVVGDNKDGDCDLQVDENDTCFNPEYGVYRQDTDLDGAFGEDCREIKPGNATVTKAEDPVCVIIDKPVHQCWTVCQCKCSWVEKFESTKNMTMQELTEALADENAEIQGELTVDAKKLSSATSQKQSKDDKRTSAASIGYVGIAMFCLVFGSIFILDVSSLIRDARILMTNLKEGYDRVFGC